MHVGGRRRCVQAEESDASMATVIESSTDEVDRFKSREEQLKADGVEYCLQRTSTFTASRSARQSLSTISSG